MNVIKEANEKFKDALKIAKHNALKVDDLKMNKKINGPHLRKIR